MLTNNKYLPREHYQVNRVTITRRPMYKIPWRGCCHPAFPVSPFLLCPTGRPFSVESTLTTHMRRFVNIKHWANDLISQSVFVSLIFKSYTWVPSWRFFSISLQLPCYAPTAVLYRVGSWGWQSIGAVSHEDIRERVGEWRWWMHNDREVLNCLSTPSHVMAFPHKVEIYIFTIMKL